MVGLSTAEGSGPRCRRETTAPSRLTSRSWSRSIFKRGARRAGRLTPPKAVAILRLARRPGSRHGGQRPPGSGLPRLLKNRRPRKLRERDFGSLSSGGQWGVPTVASPPSPVPCTASRVAGAMGGTHVLPHVSAAIDAGNDVVPRQRIPRLRRFPADPTARLLDAGLFARPLVSPPPSWYCVLETAGAPARRPQTRQGRRECLIRGRPPR